jgi:molecular chaperone DnaK (HSP70)
MVKTPTQAYIYISQIIGKTFGHPLVREMEQYFPFRANLIKDEERGTYAIKHDANTTFNPEELAGMILNFARSTAEAYTSTKVRDCVITVPSIQ